MSFNVITARSVLAVLEHLPPSPTVLELGNQTFGLADKLLQKIVAEARTMSGGRAVDFGALESLIGMSVEDRSPQTESFYRALGFERYVAIDVNSRYGSLIMDLNTNLGDNYGFRDTFDLVTNNGTGEHVFDQRAVFENMHDLTVAGGLMLHVMPFVNWLNHGFYNFNPVLFVDVAAANGYEVLRLSLANKNGFEEVVDLDRGAVTPRPDIVPPDSSARRKAALLAYRQVRTAAGLVRQALRPTNGHAPTLGLGDAIVHLSPSATTHTTPLAAAVERIMRDESVSTGGDYPVLGNVMIVAALRKGHDRPFRVPMAGRYVDAIETDAVKSIYRLQHGAAAEERSASGEGASGPGQQT